MRLRFIPLFFLPRRTLCWVYEQARFERLLDTPFGWLFAVVDRGGIWFQYKGDEVLWTWPWTRKGLAPYISTALSGTGEFGDARYWTLAELDRDWEEYFEAERRIAERERRNASIIQAEVDRRVIEGCVAEVELFNQPRPDGAIGRVL